MVDDKRKRKPGAKGPEEGADKAPTPGELGPGEAKLVPETRSDEQGAHAFFTFSGQLEEEQRPYPEATDTEYGAATDQLQAPPHAPETAPAEPPPAPAPAAPEEAGEITATDAYDDTRAFLLPPEVPPLPAA
ncbi:MAG: hypothetical protein ACREID_00865, partial [Planctomycetota bacterium]